MFYHKSNKYNLFVNYRVIKIKLTKHDRYVNSLVERIKDKYDSVSTNVVIKNDRRTLGEIDILAKRGDEFDVYEVKCSHRIIKARFQIKKIRKNIGFHLANAYFYCGMSGALCLIR